MEAVISNYFLVGERQIIGLELIFNNLITVIAVVVHLWHQHLGGRGVIYPDKERGRGGAALFVMNICHVVSDSIFIHMYVYVLQLSQNFKKTFFEKVHFWVKKWH